MKLNLEMKQNNFIVYLKRILSYPKPSHNLYATIDTIKVEDDNAFFKKLLYIKQYNSLLDSHGLKLSFLMGDRSDRTEDDILISFRKDKTLVETVPFSTNYAGILSLGGKKAIVDSVNPFITVGIKTRKTILFESYDDTLQIDLSKSSNQNSLNFTRFKTHNSIFKEFCIEQSRKYLKDVFPFIKLISNNYNLKTLCLEFISVKSKLFFGDNSIDCYSLGSSLLFFHIKFRDSCILSYCDKIKEYIQSVLSENMISPNKVSSYIFLFETVCFLGQIGKKRVIMMNSSESELCENDLLFNSIDRMCIDEDDYKAKESIVKDIPLNLATAHSFIFDTTNLTANENSKCFNRILHVYCRVLDFFNSNLQGYLNEQDVLNPINNILSSKRFYKHEVLGILVHVTSINNFFREKRPTKIYEPDLLFKIRAKSTLEDLKEQIETLEIVNKKILDYEFLGLIQEILRNTHEYFSKLKKEKSDLKATRIKVAVDLLIEIYYSLVYIDNKIITDIFCYGVLRTINVFNIENIKKLTKHREFTDEIVEKLKENRNIYDLERELCHIMEIDLDSTYNTIEKKVLLGISGVKRIKKGKYLQTSLERGKVFDEEMFIRYKIYIYEYLKEKNTVKDFEMYFKRKDSQ